VTSYLTEKLSKLRSFGMQ